MDPNFRTIDLDRNLSLIGKTGFVSWCLFRGTRTSISETLPIAAVFSNCFSTWSSGKRCREHSGCLFGIQASLAQELTLPNQFLAPDPFLPYFRNFADRCRLLKLLFNLELREKMSGAFRMPFWYPSKPRSGTHPAKSVFGS